MNNKCVFLKKKDNNSAHSTDLGVKIPWTVTATVQVWLKTFVESPIFYKLQFWRFGTDDYLRLFPQRHTVMLKDI